MMEPIIILKGRGVWFDGHHMLNREELAELANEWGVDPSDIDPTEINPKTRERWDTEEFEAHASFGS